MNAERPGPRGPRRKPRAPSAPAPPDDVVFGLHPVFELLRLRPREVERVWVARERERGAGRLLRLAREAGVPVTHLPRSLLARKVGPHAAHQGIAAQVAPYTYAAPEALVEDAAALSDALLVYVDGVVDPGNLGSILRTSAAAGVAGVLLSRENTVGITPAVSKAAAGTLPRVAVARESRPGARLEDLERRGFRIVGLDPRGESTWDAVDLRGRVVLLAGGEERGLRPGLQRRCHHTVAVPLAEGVESLNVGVAVGVVLFEAVRQRRAAGRNNTS